MSWKPSQIAICSIGFLHLLFMFGELFRARCPFILNLVLQKRGLTLAPTDHIFVAQVVQNAGIYNGIVALALFVAASCGPAAFRVQVALLAGGIVAGVFGCATLAHEVIVQAILGLIALFIVIRFRRPDSAVSRSA